MGCWPQRGETAELLHRQLLNQLLDVGKSTTDQIVPADFDYFLCDFILGSKSCATITEQGLYLKVALINGRGLMASEITSCHTAQFKG